MDGFQDVYNIPPVCSLYFCVQRDVHLLKMKLMKSGRKLASSSSEVVRLFQCQLAPVL